MRVNRSNDLPSHMASDESLRDRYLDLVQATVANKIYGESEIETRLRAWVQRLRHPWSTRRGTFSWPAKAHTMLPTQRLDNVRKLVKATLLEGIPGDYIETGVWRGGTCILIRAILAAYGVADRRVICADSFQGLPRPDLARFRHDKRDRLYAFSELAVSEEQVRANFATYGLLDEQVVFLKGFFQDTLPNVPSESFALLRLDGDMYGSTMDALVNLYNKLSMGGYVIIDDYGALNACRRAVHDFLDSRDLSPTINRIDVSGVWWRKTD